VSVSFELLHNSNKQFNANLYQSDACGSGFSDTRFFNNTNMLVVASRGL